MKRILLTGCAGFIGSHILEKLLFHGCKVVGIDNLSTGKVSNLKEVKQSLARYGDHWKNFDFYNIDIGKPAHDELELLFHTYQNIDAICHQAALGSVPRSIKAPIEVHNSNVNGFLNILHAALNANIKRVVFASSSSVYGHSPVHKEGHEDFPLSPYALTKTINEHYARMYKKTYDINFIGLRYFNVFGPRQDRESEHAPVIAKWSKLISDGEDVVVNGSSDISRDFTYVDNVVKANLQALFTYSDRALNKIYNVGCGQSTSLSDLHQMMTDEFSPNSKGRMLRVSARRGDIKNSRADISLISDCLNYTPMFSLKEGLKLMGKYYRYNGVEPGHSLTAMF